MTEALSAPYLLEYTYRRSMGPVIGRFLEGLRYEILEGVKTADGRVLCPPQEYDETGAPTTGEYVALRPTGVLKSWTWVPVPRPTHPRQTPFAFAIVQIDGTDSCITHILDAKDPKQLQTGMRVRVRWAAKKQGTIQDIECFEPSSPILPGPVHLDFSVMPGLHQTAYLRGFEQGKIIGGKCSTTGKVYVPPRGSSPVDGKPTEEYVELAHTGVLTTFTVVRIPFEGQKLTPPYCFGAIVLDNADLPLYHLISGVPHDEIRMGMRVKAKWKPRDQWETSVENILYFEPTGEPDAAFETYSEHL